MYPCNKCLENHWSLENINDGDISYMKAKCKVCGNEVEFGHRNVKSPKSKSNKIEVYFDGAANLREKAGYGFLVKINGKKVKQYGRVECDSMDSTCNVAEHYALMKALEWLIKKDHLDNILIYGDSKMVISQIFSGWKARSKHPYYPFYAKNMELIKNFNNIKGHHIMREYNSEADELSKLGLNNQKEAT